MKDNNTHEGGRVRPFYCRAFIPLLAFVLFIVVFALLFIIHRGAAMQQYDAMNQKSLAIQEFGMADAADIMGYFTSYGIFGGIIFGIFTLILSYIIYGLARIGKWNGAAGLSLLLSYGLFAYYGYEFAYEGPGTVTWANGITAFLGFPLLVSGMILSLIGVVFIIMVLRSSKKGAA